MRINDLVTKKAIAFSQSGGFFLCISMLKRAEQNVFSYSFISFLKWEIIMKLRAKFSLNKADIHRV
ncbi:hypothetical protein A7K91_20015 [Paenibacillus oryzae]|uniref:Uncharacterized protein n=1 Tax=Paenibacillus oryzae TaxID=1844972 RepID=A0A1A5YHY1_9BACL|nr:hypothetical protein A7K91_20015 [Paenibacillus oryzae]